MTNEEKAKEIAIEIQEIIGTSPFSYDTIVDEIMKMAKWKDKQFHLEQQEICCANCEHLNVINSKKLYVRCEMWKWKFKPFEADTRNTKCNRYKNALSESAFKKVVEETGDCKSQFIKDYLEFLRHM